MDTLKAFLKCASGMQYYEFFEMPEAPRGSIFNRGFSFTSLETRPLKNTEGVLVGADFFNKTGGEVSVSIVVGASADSKTADIEIKVRELEIRSFYVFKNDGFFSVPAAMLKNGFEIGLEKGSERMSFAIGGPEAERIFGKSI